MISPDDPRLTAHADGALPPEEAARLERELAADPAARAELERLRALQRELREAFAEETAEAETPVAAGEPEFAPVPQPAPESARVLRFPDWLTPLLAAACIVLVAGAMIIPTVGKVRETARRSVDSSNLRQIGQAALIFASDNQDRLPEATDVWDFARQLAIGSGLNDATIWLSSMDPAMDLSQGVSTVLASDRRSLEPAFEKAKPSWAVALGQITINAPATTPIAWTRGLRPDGTWAKHSPYGEQGGHIVFLGGNVQFYRNVAGQLHRYDGQGMTGNILEALPPGSRIGEYVPTAEESMRWSRAWRPDVTKSRRDNTRGIILAVAGVAFVAAFSAWLCNRLRFVPFFLISCVIGAGVVFALMIRVRECG